MPLLLMPVPCPYKRASVLFGPCSQQVKTTTDAWYGVNVGAKWAGCTAPLLDAYTTATPTISESAGGGCGRYTDYQIKTNLSIAQASAVTFSLSASGTATAGKDYTLNTNMVTYNPGELGLKSVTLRVFDDAVVEGDETLNVLVSSATNSFSKTLAFTIADDDIIPVIGNGTVSLLNENFESTASGSVPSGWTVTNQISPTPVNWVVRPAPSASVLAYTTNRLIIEMPLVTGQALYDQNTAAQTTARTPLINGTGLNNITIKFTFSAGGEPACSPACDYGTLVYSTDGVNFSNFQFGTVIMYAQVTDSVYTMTLPPSFDNKKFYIGFQWNNDTNGGTSNSVTIDNLTVTGLGRKVEGDLNDNVMETINAEGSKPAYFYSTNDGQIIASITNVSQDLGCVIASIKQSGSTSITFNGGNRTEKVFQITPSTNSTTASYDVTLYYKTSELSVFGAGKSALKMLKSDAAVIDNSTLANSVIATPVYADFPTQGYTTYKATFTGFSQFTMVNQSTILPIFKIDLRAAKQANGVGVDWDVETTSGIREWSIEKSLTGNVFSTIFTQSPPNSSSTIYHGSTTDANPAKGNNYYRLKVTDNQGLVTYSNIRIVNLSGNGAVITISPNPATDKVEIAGTVDFVKPVLQIFNSIGMKMNAPYIVNGNSIAINTSLLNTGVYIVKLMDANGVQVNEKIIISK